MKNLVVIEFDYDRENASKQLEKWPIPWLLAIYTGFYFPVLQGMEQLNTSFQASGFGM